MKKLMIFLMVAIPLVIVILINFTVDVVIGNVSIAVDRIELDKTFITANIDEKISLNATIYPRNATNQEVIWASTDEEVASVDLDGNVSFIGFGKGYITATTADGNKMASCYFYVTDTVVHQVELSTPKSEIHVGTTVQLSVQVLPNEAENKNITFVSSDNTIAKVDQNGLVTGLKVGYVTITAISEDGGHTDFINLAVINPVTDIVLSTEYAITAEDKYSIGYQIYPSNATNTNVTFTVDDPTIASVDNVGRVSFIKAGQVQVTLTTVDGGFSKTMTIVYTAGYAQSLNLKSYSINAQIGDPHQVIEYTTMPSYLTKTEVTFSSSNKDVAYVSNGYLYFIGGGNATITAKVERAENDFITQTIAVYVESPATGILIDKEIITAEKQVQLTPSSYPSDSTNNKFFYHTSSSLVSVDSSGLVTFLTDNPATAQVTIFANNDYSEISTTISIEYTAGKAKRFAPVSDNLVINYGQTTALEYEIFPTNASTKDVYLTILSQNNNAGSGDVVEILSDGSIRGIGGGKAQMEVSLILLGGEKQTYVIDIEVLRDAEEVVISLDLDKQDGVYVTAENTASFDYQVLPLDATDKNVSWSVNDKSMAVILGQSLRFNQTGTVLLIGTTASGHTQQVQIRYTGSYPISAEVGILDGEQIREIPEEVSVGESFNVVLKNIFPSNTYNKAIVLSVSNQSTASPLGRVLDVTKNTFTAVAGGQATLTIYISTTVVLTYQITVTQPVQKISVSPAFIQTTDSSVALEVSVLPIDATNKNVTFEVLTPEIAYIRDGVLYFKTEGIAKIIVKSQENSNISFSFTIEKIEKGVSVVDPTISSFEMKVGDKVRFDLASLGINYNSFQIQLDQNAEILSVENGTISALESGKAKVVVNLYGEDSNLLASYQIEITVKQLVENIVYNGSAEEYNGYLTTAVDTFKLDFLALPESATDTTLVYEIVNSYDSNGMAQNIAIIEGESLRWIQSGTLTLKVSSADNSVSRTFNLRYTGGDALSAEINVSEEISLNVGDVIEIKVTSWIPSDTVNKVILIRELSHSLGVNVVKIENNTITALNGGSSQIVVELSNGITKNILINVIKKVSSISVANENIITGLDRASINATVLPSTATNKTLSFSLKEDVDWATLNGNEVVFVRAGSVTVIVSTTDGSNLQKEVKVTSTMGYLYSISLNSNERNINKGATFSLYVTGFLPLDATHKDISFTILSQTASGGSDQDVISLVESGNSYLVEGLYGGRAVVRAYSQNADGELVYQDCVITVNSPVEKVDIQFDKDLEFYQNYYVTSKNQISFTERLSPIDATIRDLTYTISDNTCASVSGGVITFNKVGFVTITFTSVDKTNGVKSVTYNFNYVGDSLLEAALDLSGFDNKVLNLMPGQEKVLALSNQVPKDNKNVKITISNIVEERVDSTKDVILFENGVIKALNGGKATFTLMANNINLGSFTVIVTREAEEIVVEKDDIYIANPGYQIYATVLPTDTTDKKLDYKSSDTSIATVDQYGAVVFSNFGVVVITISSKSNPSIFKEIQIEYAREIKGISFTETRYEMYVDDQVYLSVIPNPINAEGFTYTFTLDDNSVASLVEDSLHGSYKLKGLAPGKVTVTLSVDGTDISYSKTYTFFTKLNNIALDLDNANDPYGHGGYRVFGNKFYKDGTNSSSLIMTGKVQPTNNPNVIVDLTEYADLIEWTTSDATIAKVDENGKVTFVGTGVVTITARQKVPFSGANVTSDFYTFYVVEGVNIFSSSDYTAVVKLLSNENKTKSDNYSALVLQSDIVVPSSHDTNVVDYNIYGNGRMIDFSNYSPYNKMSISKSNIVIDNVVLRGASFNETKALSQLENTGKVLLIKDHAKNVLIYNTIIENCFILAEVNSSEATFKGCIIRNSYSGGLVISRKKDDTTASTVTVEDCIFARSLLSCIQFAPDTSSQLVGYESKLILKGDVYIYNWLTLDEFQGGAILDFFNKYEALAPFGQSIINQIKQNIIENYSDFKYTYNGKDYYLFGILDLYASVLGSFTFQSNGIIDRSQLNNKKFNYQTAPLTGSINVGITADYRFELLTCYGNTNQNKDQPYIKPGMTYEGDQVVLGEIKQPMRNI